MSRLDLTPISAALAVNGTTLRVERRGTGAPLLLIHGAGEDAAMLRPQATALAAAGFDVITYDRRGTGASGRDAWPGGGADQHAADADALLAALGLESATVVGLSSGGVIALAMAARHSSRVGRVIAWEPPAVGVVPGGTEAPQAMMAPVHAHLAAHAGDYVGAQAILLHALTGMPVSPDDPELAAIRANAEPMVRDDPSITLVRFTAAELATRDVTIVVGDEPNELIAAAVAVLESLTGRPAIVAPGPHEVYLTDPPVLVDVVCAA